MKNIASNGFRYALFAVVGATAILFFLGSQIAVLAIKSFLVLFRNSDICTISQSWAGLSEAMRTNGVSAQMAAQSRLRSLDSLGFQEWSTPFGTMWFPRDSRAWTVHFALAQFDNGAYPGIQIRSGDIVLDCGGYVGDWTKWVLHAGAAKAVIVEPAKEALECIRRNLAEEIKKGRVIVYPKGVWDSEGILHLGHIRGNPAANSVVGTDTSDGESIEVTTIDQIVSELGLRRLDIIKMDIEGAETRAIHGAQDTLKRFRPHLAIATEHTSNILQNNRNVIQAIHEVAPFYQERCGYCIVDRGILTPWTLYFDP
jgi:FkbM family methyltransferase